jgi:hypothetical protein
MLSATPLAYDWGKSTFIGGTYHALCYVLVIVSAQSFLSQFCHLHSAYNPSMIYFSSMLGPGFVGTTSYPYHHAFFQRLFLLLLYRSHFQTYTQPHIVYLTTLILFRVRSYFLNQLETSDSILLLFLNWSIFSSRVVQVRFLWAV